MDKILRASMLYDFYSDLLTEKQKTMFEMYYLNDLSLHEIAEEFSISRQAVFDLLKRTNNIMENYEEKLLLINKYHSDKTREEAIIGIIDSLALKYHQNIELTTELHHLKNLIGGV